MYMTLDGFAEAPDEPENDPETSRQFWEAMWTGHWDDVDTLLLGRKTYEKWAGFWPDQIDSEDKHMREFARFSSRVEKVVFSRKLKSADWSNSQIVRGPVGKEIPRLRSLPGKNMIVGGGPRLVQSIIAEGLADELYLTVYPSIIGHGKPLFRWAPDPDFDEDSIPQDAPDRHDFRLLECRPLGTSHLFLHYAASRSTSSR